MWMLGMNVELNVGPEKGRREANETRRDETKLIDGLMENGEDERGETPRQDANADADAEMQIEARLRRQRGMEGSD